MKLSAETYELRKHFGDEQAIEIFANAGFDAMDYTFYWLDDDSEVWSDCYRTYACKLRNLTEKRGICYNQAHAPFDSYIFGNERYNRDIFDKITRSIEFAALLGVNTIVVHPIICPVQVDRIQFNLNFYQKLLPFAERNRIRIALENLFVRRSGGNIVPDICSSADEFCECVDKLNSEWITACLDVGHSLVVGSKPEVDARILGRRLTAVHIHDNKRILDDHMLPGFGEINWEAFALALAEINYSGDFTLEIIGWLMHFEPEVLPEAMSLAASVGRCLIAKVEKYKKKGSH